MRKFAVVTTFNQQGLDRYAQRFINTFDKNMPNEIDLLIYSERANPTIPKNKRRTVQIFDVEKQLRNTLIAFKKRWKGVPKANGLAPDGSRLDAGKAFKWDAVRFSHKVYAIFDAAKETDADVLIWMDADTVVHSPVSYEFFDKFIPSNVFTAFLGRGRKYTECGWYSMNLKHPHADKFFEEFQKMYDDAENGIFQEKEWHDSYIFDVVRKRHEQETGTVNKDISSGIEGEGHPLINSELGAYFDHLKGDRKSTGQSKAKDLKVQRSEDYWKSVR
jgi:hypothetical protein